MANNRSGGPRVLRPRGIFNDRIWPVKSAARLARLQKRSARLGVDVALAAAERKIIRAARREGLTLLGGRVDLPRASDALHAAQLNELSDAYLAIRAARASVRALLDGRDDIRLTLELSDAAFRAGLALGRYEAYCTPTVRSRRRSVLNLKPAKSTVSDEQIRAALRRNPTKTAAAAELGISTRQLANRRKGLD